MQSLIVYLVLTCLWPALAVDRDLTGTSALYQKGKVSKSVVGYMRITRQQGNSSSTGNTWTGQGIINGNSGSRVSWDQGYIARKM